MTVGNAQGRAFTGLHGDGVLAADGNATIANWPGAASAVAGFRGGSRGGGETNLRASDRLFAADTFAARDSGSGFRGARGVPALGGD